MNIATVKNKRITENNTLIQAIADLDKLRQEAHAKDIAVKDILAEKDKLIREARMPEGFGFTEEGIQYNGFDLDRASQSSSALYIAALKLASLNVGNVRFLYFDASMLDNKSLEEVRAWAEENDLQLGIELVTRDGNEEIRYELMEDVE